MLYPTDFNRYPNKWKLNENVRNINIATIGLQAPRKKSKLEVKLEKVDLDSNESIFVRYLNNSTVHGFRYLTDPAIRRSERYVELVKSNFYRFSWWKKIHRITWCIVVVLALFGVIYVCYLLQVQFSTNVLATVVETTFFPVFEIPYPAITICNNNRINWKRVPAAIDL